MLRPTWNGAESSCGAGAMISATSRFCRRVGDASHKFFFCVVVLLESCRDLAFESFQGVSMSQVFTAYHIA